MPLFANGMGIYLHLPVMLVAVSFVYSATRHDKWKLIVGEAVGWGLRMGAFLGFLALVLYLVSTYPKAAPYLMIPVGLGILGYYVLNSPWVRKWRDKQVGEKAK